MAEGVLYLQDIFSCLFLHLEINITDLKFDHYKHNFRQLILPVLSTCEKLTNGVSASPHRSIFPTTTTNWKLCLNEYYYVLEVKSQRSNKDNSNWSIQRDGAGSATATAKWRLIYLPNSQTNLVITLLALSQLFYNFINTTDYHLGRYKPSSPSTTEFNVNIIWSAQPQNTIRNLLLN